MITKDEIIKLCYNAIEELPAYKLMIEKYETLKNNLMYAYFIHIIMMLIIIVCLFYLTLQTKKFIVKI